MPMVCAFMRFQRVRIIQGPVSDTSQVDDPHARGHRMGAWYCRILIQAHLLESQSHRSAS